MSRTQGAPSRRPTDSTRTARRRRRGSRKVKLVAGAIPVVLVAAGLAIVVATGGVGAALNTASVTCLNPTTVRVSTTEEFLPVVRRVADQVATDTNNAISCTVYDISAVPPAVAVSQIAGDGNDRPDAWVPDSSVWVQRVDAQLGEDAPPKPVIVAQSPLVIAVPQDRAARYAGAGVPSWQELLGGDLPAQMSNPADSTTAMLALTTVRKALGDSPAMQQDVGGAMIRLSRTAADTTDDLFAQAAEKKAAAPGFPASEQQVVQYDLQHPEALLVPVVPTPSTGRLDYPFVALATEHDAVGRAVLALRDGLTSEAGHRAIRAAGFRTAEGTGGPTPTPGVPTPVVRLLADPTLKEVDAALSTWSTVSKEMRMIAVIDVSGSMTDKTGGASRISIAQGATDTALRIFPPRSQVGLWAFATDKDGPGKDWKELVPPGELSAPSTTGTQRDALLRANAGINALVGGDTGLYDTVLAAYQRVKQGFDPTRVNSVVILTDGQNDDKSGLTLDQLLARLKALSDPSQPIAVITVGMGPSADASVLDKISRATGGKSYIARQPSDIKTVFVEALLQRGCRPSC
ncbi:substrate-binding domain-containing protein [Oryzihumus sp.]|uniref:substrate-binding domain-containing protein n=1 Tax=Oryzihumus sp. TaxID=1968903 RepID=UPI002ED7EF00